MKKFKRLLSVSLAILVLATVIPFGTFMVSANQSTAYSGGYNTNFNLTGNGATDIVSVAKAQIGKTQAQLKYYEGWCDNFVSDCAILANQANAVPQGGDVADFRRNLINAGAQQVPSPIAGDVVIFYCTHCCSWVHAALMADSVTCINGNSWGGNYSHVEQYGYYYYYDGCGSSSYISSCFFRPAYKGSTPKPTITKPSAPTLSVNTTDIGVGEAVTVSWQAVAGAQKYKIYMSDGQVQEVTGTSAAFKLNTAGTYTAYGYAINGSYTSNQSAKTSAIRVHNPSTVTFKDYDGTILPPVQTVGYNKNATVPSTPSRKGYTFTGWDKSYTNIKSDTVITAQYKINTYNVKFYDKAGKQIGATQKVNYGSDATPPTDTNNPAGYDFIGWSNKDYLNVGSDGGENGKTYNVYGIYSWYNEDLPIYVDITSATRQEDGYYVYFDLTNYPNAITRGRAVVTLKTAQGKLVDMTESAAFSIPKDTTKRDMEVFVPCDKAASIIEVIVVDSYSSGVPISQSDSSGIDQAQMWSDWTPEKPDESQMEIETKKQYRYRDKKYTTSSSSSLSGWTKYDTKTSYGNWNAWTTTPLTSSSTRDVQSEWVSASYKTQYVYKRYKYWYAAAGCYYYSYGQSWADSMGYSGWWEYNILDYQLGYVTSFDGVACYGGTGANSWFRADCSRQGAYTTFQISTLVSNGYTRYRYRDINYTYCYYKWDDNSWSEWSDTSYTATSDRQVESRNIYRGKSIAAATEDNSGKVRTVSGKLDSSFGGKQITLYVYKITEASDWTNEYIGQSFIGLDGSYNFSFKLREEPSEITGDFTVAIGIEGTTNLMVIDTIEAPKPVYTVNFFDKNGNLVSSQQVTKGENAVAPTLADLTGYTFACWDNSFVNINGDIDIMPVYVARQYAVVYIDWTHETFDIKTFNYGEPLILDDPEPVEGFDFVGWDKILDGTEIVTDNLVITARYEKKAFEVSFYDYDNNLISQQTVEYGEYPEIPDLAEDDVHVFLNWEQPQTHDDSVDPFYITDTTFFTPVYIYDETVETPYASVKGGQYDETQFVELLCDTPDAVIYYTLDGSDPKTSETAKIYTNNIMVCEQAIIKFYACAFEKNDSPIVTEMYITDRSPYMEFEQMPIYAQEELDTYDVITTRAYRYVNATTTAKTASEAAELEKDGWIEDVSKRTYSDFSEWTTEELNLGDEYIEPIIDTKVVDSFGNDITSYNDPTIFFEDEECQTMYRFKSIIKTYNRYTYSTTKPVDISYTQKFVYSYLYIPKHFLTLKDTLSSVGDKYYENKFIVLDGSKITSDMLNKFDGFTFEGLYTDEDLTNRFDMENETITEDTVLYVNYSINSYNVTFYDKDNRIVDVQSVEYGSFAEAPELPEVEGFVFIGWNNEFLGITRNTEVHPKYISEDEYARISLNFEDNALLVGSELNLEATITPAILADTTKITWNTSDPAVAVVDHKGTVTAVHSGSVQITAVASGSGETAVCNIEVISNPSVELILNKNSSYKLDDARNLRGIKAGKNTVADVLNEFDNTKAQIISQDGTKKETDSLVATGDCVVLYNGKNIVDTIPVILTGDMGDGKVNNRDVSMLMRYLVDKESPDTYQLAAMDVNGDGEVNNRDASMLARYLVGKETI